MADTQTDTQPDQLLVINTQYIKDLSFENPNAPKIYSALAERPPELNINIDVKSTPLHQRTFEVVLNMRIQATASEQTAFLVELDYAGMVTLAESVSAAEAEALLLIETPRHLFPFARSIVAAVTRDGGFPPLVVNPIDFEQFYRLHKKARGQAPAAAEAAAPDA
ncbi:MAG: protein-export chaperone SecB [Kiloniellaceae bacterium]